VAALNNWTQEIDAGSFTGVLLLDLTKAFDTVPHHLLLMELASIGCKTCNHNTLLWFASYLNNRTQRVIFHDDISRWKAVTRGGPHGSCFSPLLLNIYVRELPLRNDSDTFRLADDTNLSKSDVSLKVIKQSLTTSFLTTRDFCSLRHEV